MRTLVIGGGAAGMAAAICAARRGHEIILTEAQSRVGRKLLATGNGRCNLSNVDLSRDHYHCDADITPLLKAYDTTFLRGFFAEIGLKTCVEDGRVYPAGFSAASVLDCMRLAARDLGVREMCDKALIGLKPGAQFSAKYADGSEIAAENVILALGGSAAPQLGGSEAGCDILRKLGHTIVPESPALTPICTETARIKALNGLRARCDVRLGERVERGEVLFAEYGVSGIAAMQLSRNARPGMALTLDFAPDVSKDALFDDLMLRAQALPKRSLEEFLIGMYHRLIGIALLKVADVKPLNRSVDTLTADEIMAIVRATKTFELKITGMRAMKYAQVAAGGAHMREFDLRTMESLKHRHLHAVGETLNIDGDCGGYNLHWAFISGIIAGRHVGEI